MIALNGPSSWLCYRLWILVPISFSPWKCSLVMLMLALPSIIYNLRRLDIYRSIRQGFPLAPTLYVLTAEGFGYLLAHSVSSGLVCGISLPKSSSQLINGHFVDDYFLTLLEDEENIKNALHCLDTFCQASGSTIQWHKMLCYHQSFLPSPPWLNQF